MSTWLKEVPKLKNFGLVCKEHQGIQYMPSNLAHPSFDFLAMAI